MSACIPDAISISKDPARKPSPCLASHTAMASFSELANLSADMVSKAEDSIEARPAMRPDGIPYGRNCYTPAWLLSSLGFGDHVGAEVGQLRETGHRRVAGETG